MFEPVPMTRLTLLILERDQRAVLRYLGGAGVVQLIHERAGPDTAPLPPLNHHEETEHLDQISSRLQKLRRSLPSPSVSGSLSAHEFSLEEAQTCLHELEKQSGVLLQRRAELRARLAGLDASVRQISAYRGVELPLDQPDDSSFLHFVTGTLPAKNLEKLRVDGDVALLPLAEQNGRLCLIGVTVRQRRADLDRALQQAGFQLEPLPVVAGTTVDCLAGQSRQEAEAIAGQLAELDAKLQTIANHFEPALAQIEVMASNERRLLEAEQNFPHTESSVLVTGWIPGDETAGLEQRVRKITQDRCIINLTPAEKTVGREIPVLLRHPRWLRPFARLMTAYGLPQYRELEPTLFVALSYLLMFGMMFGDAGHGLVLALGGLALLFASHHASWRDAGVLLLCGGGASLIFGVVYGSYFGLPQFKAYALWHDPLEGNPAGLMLAAIKIGIAMISLGLVLNIINRFRQGDLIGGLLDKFGGAGLLFYWGTLMLLAKSSFIHEQGLLIPGILFFWVVPVLCWGLKEPIQAWNSSDKKRATAPGDVSTVITESVAGIFEGLLSYLANTISFVRLAAYAMSHAALLLAAFMIAADVKQFSFGGNGLAVLVIIAGNLVAIALEGVIASVQALRLEYYEFFGKFFTGGGRPFQPFRLQTNPVASSPL